MDTCLAELAAQQAEVVAAWQLLGAGWSRDRIAHHARRGGWRRLHRGVYLLSHGRPSRLQLWWAAALTKPQTFLTHGSASACFDIHRFSRGFEVVTRPGHGGPRRHPGLLVFRSRTLAGETTTHMGIPITTPERTLVDIGGGLSPKRAGRALREALRLRLTTAGRVIECTTRHGGQPKVIANLAKRYASIPYARTRSDAEARALELLHDAGLELPAVNVRIAGQEADLVWFEPRAIMEIDGPQYHQFRDEDARKAALWREAGYRVDRVPSDLVYDEPQAFVARCVAAMTGR
jgi:very-short-patch-repair endonuclease